MFNCSFIENHGNNQNISGDDYKLKNNNNNRMIWMLVEWLRRVIIWVCWACRGQFLWNINTLSSCIFLPFTLQLCSLLLIILTYLVTWDQRILICKYSKHWIFDCISHKQFFNGLGCTSGTSRHTYYTKFTPLYYHKSLTALTSSLPFLGKKKINSTTTDITTDAMESMCIYLW